MTARPAALTAEPNATGRLRPRRRTRMRGLLMVPAGLAMLAGLDAALTLLGLPTVVSSQRLPETHGMVMVLGFVATVVALERSVALGRPAGFLPPALLGVGALVAVSPAPLAVGQGLLVLGTVGLVVVYRPLWLRQRDDAILVQALGGVLAASVAALWLRGVPVTHLLPWLVGFIVLTIAGERLELARIAMGPGAGRTLVIITGALLVSVTAALLWPAVGYRLVGLALAVLVGWLSAHDAARRTIRASGLTRFMAASMLAGYVWLAVAAGIWLVGGPAYGGGAYDAVVHAVFLGFTISMVMAHAPVILPAVLGRPLPYRRFLWAPLVLLHVSLVLRLWVGDARGVAAAWQAGGVLNIFALLLFVVLAAWLAARGRVRQP